LGSSLLNSPKEQLRKRFSSEPEKYYRVSLFDEIGFLRKKCPKCNMHFWTLDANRVTCNEQPCESYSFIGNPPTKERLGYIEAWQRIRSYFSNKGHHILQRYPVVCRWRPDLYFTIASIVDFQRIESGKVVFEFPYNPLVVPQMCLRFSDIANVGMTGRHSTSFCMIGQQALANEQGYWKDRCIELDYELLTSVFGIPKDEIVFKEDVWLGYGAFGYSLEYCVAGLELGNAVFTAFEGEPERFSELKEKVVDMGAGLERFAWISQGTSNSYDAVFPQVIQKLENSIATELPKEEFMEKYFELAGGLDSEQFRGGLDAISDALSKSLSLPSSDFKKNASLLQAFYSIADHTRTLAFAIADGALPSNVGGGYNLRVILRRALDFAEMLGLQVPLSEVAIWHADSLEKMYPELKEHLEDIKIVFSAEEQKHKSTKARSSSLLSSLAKAGRKIDLQKMVQLYDSEGITPETLVRQGIADSVPADFYSALTSRHLTQKQKADVVEEGQAGWPNISEVEGLPETKLLFYENRDQFDFKALVLKIIGEKYVVLDQTAFYARAGGQEPDHGTLAGYSVTDVRKYDKIIVHQLSNPCEAKIHVGDTVTGRVDRSRREKIMRHHTATHIVNGASRKVIGSWVWQHSAFKDEDMARLDITHFSKITREQLLEIERISNEIVRNDLPVSISWLPRSEAEQKYGFRLYQGGAAPTKLLRIVSIDNWDVEACGGTHCSRTGEVGLIKITRTERIQDGVERLEFVAGEPAIKYVEAQETLLLDSASELQTTPERIYSVISALKSSEESYRKRAKSASSKLAEMMVPLVINSSRHLKKGVKVYVSFEKEEEGLNSEFHILLGERVVVSEPLAVYIGISPERERTRIIVFVGERARESGVNAGALAREISKLIGGSGGGDARFGQGGVQKVLTEENELPDIYSLVERMIS
jgi:alanyl-tRNA synthetase